MTDVPPPAERRSRPIPKRVRAAIGEIVEGRAKNITAAAKKVGMTREGLSRALSRPDIAEHLRQRAARAVALGAGRASARLINLIDAKSEHVSADVSCHILSIAGIKPAADPNVNLNVTVRAGYVLDLREPDDEMKIIAGADAIPLPAPAVKGLDNE